MSKRNKDKELIYKMVRKTIKKFKIKKLILNKKINLLKNFFLNEWNIELIGIND